MKTFRFCENVLDFGFPVKKSLQDLIFCSFSCRFLNFNYFFHLNYKCFYSGVFSTGAMGALAPVILVQSITVTAL